MSSISTLIIKKPNEFLESKRNCQESHSFGFISLYLWTVAAIVAACNIETSANVTGIFITVKIQDVMFTLLSTFMLFRGINTGNPYLILPWILSSSWNMYTCQYPNIRKLIYIFQNTKTVSVLACIAFGLHTIALATKILLILQITQVSANLWYHRKLSSELSSDIVK